MTTPTSPPGGYPSPLLAPQRRYAPGCAESKQRDWHGRQGGLVLDVTVTAEGAASPPGMC